MRKVSAFLGWWMMTLAVSASAVLVWRFMTYRYDHPRMTETELEVEFLSRWAYWLPWVVCGVAGFVLIKRAEKCSTS